jgi:FkbM family methyltransferase
LPIPLKKLRNALTSELTWKSRLRYLWAAALRRSGVGSAGGGTFYLNSGSIRLRPGSTDFKVLEEVFIGRVYGRFAGLIAKSRVVLDLGANIGLSAIFLARTAPESVVIAVEPCRVNVELLVENVRSAGLGARISTVEAFVGAERGFAAIDDSGNGEWGMRMGAREAGPSESNAAVMTLPDLVEGLGVVSVKCDIEGAERELFSRLGEWKDQVGLILLELHTELFPASELSEILRSSDYDWEVHGEVPAGASIALIALERSREKRSRKLIP